MLTFNDERHEYRWLGEVVPSVTQLMQRLQDWGFVPPDVLAAAQERGTDVHLLTQFHDEGDLAPETIGDKGAYLDAWIDFCATYKVEWSGIECQGFSQRFGFAGTYDRKGKLLLTSERDLWLIDIKTSAVRHRCMGMQLAAYRQIEAEKDSAWMLARRATVQLKPNGKYDFREWKNPKDWAAFQALISLTNWSTS